MMIARRLLQQDELRIDGWFTEHAYSGLGFLEGAIALDLAIEQWTLRAEKLLGGPVTVVGTAPLAAEAAALRSRPNWARRGAVRTRESDDLWILPETRCWACMIKVTRLVGEHSEPQSVVVLWFDARPFDAHLQEHACRAARMFDASPARPAGRDAEEDMVEAFLEPFVLPRLMTPGGSVCGVDYMGIPRLRGAVAAHPAREVLVAQMFADALIEAGAHSHASVFRGLHRGLVLTINADNILTTASADISHTHPQVILGLLGEMTVDLRAIVAAAVVRRLQQYAERAATRAPRDVWRSFMAALASDADLERRDFVRSLGIALDRALLEQMRAILQDAGAGAWGALEN